MRKCSDLLARTHRSRTKHLGQLGMAVAAALFLVPAPAAAAYIDPISGSVLIQIVSAGVLAGLVSIRRARNWVLSFFRRSKQRTRTDTE